MRSSFMPVSPWTAAVKHARGRGSTAVGGHDAEQHPALVGRALRDGALAERGEARLHLGPVLLLGHPQRIRVRFLQRGRDIGVVLRVEALLRRADRFSGAAWWNRLLQVGALLVDLGPRRATYEDRELSLTTREFDLLAFLAAHPGETFSKAELLRRVWGWEFGDNSTVTVHVRRLREKLETDPSDPRLVLTVGRSGYRIVGEDEER